MVEPGAASDFLEQMRMTNQNVGRKKTGIKCSDQQLEEFGIGGEQLEKQAAQTEGFNETDNGDESSIGIGALRQFLNQKWAKFAKNLPRAWGNVKGNGTLCQFAERPRGARRIGKNIEIDRWRGGAGSDEMMKNFADAFIARLQLGQQCRSGIKAKAACEALALLGIFRNGMRLPVRFYLQAMFNASQKTIRFIESAHF